MKKWFVLFAIILVVLFSSACGMMSSSQSEEKDENGGDSKVIKIGLILAETGPSSTLGKAQVNTAKMIQKELDEAGPIDGKKVKLLVRDYETDDTKAVIAMDKLISEGVVAVVGATQSSTTMAIIPKAVQAKIPLMATAPIMTKEQNVYAMAQATPSIASVIIDDLKKKGIKKVAWLNARDGFGVDGLPAFEPLAKKNRIKIIAHEEFDATATDMTIQLTNIRQKKPEAIVVWSRTPGAGIVSRNFKSLGMDIPMYQSTAAANAGFVEQVKDNSSNLYVVGSKMNVVENLPDSEQKDMLLNFSNNYRENFNSDPDLFAAHARDGIGMILEAIKKDHTTSTSIIDYFNKELGNFAGASGTINSKNPMGGAQADGLHLLSIENGKWKY